MRRTTKQTQMPETQQNLTIQLNGNDFDLAAPATVKTLVDIRQPPPPFAVEVNKRLVRHTDYEQTPLSAGDAVEVVTLVGGG